MKLKFALFIILLMIIGCPSKNVTKDNSLIQKSDPKPTAIISYQEEPVGQTYVTSASIGSSSQIVATTTKSKKIKLLKDNNIIEVSEGIAKFNASKIMKLGTTNRVTLSVTNIENQQAINKGSKILISPSMKAALFGKDFNIKNISNEEQKINYELGITTWEWDVIPKKSGKLNLEVRLSMIVPNFKDLPSMVETVEVDVDWWESFVLFYQENKTIVLTSIVGAVGGICSLIIWFIKRRFDKNKTEA